MTLKKHYFQQPSLKQKQLAFIVEDDLWLYDFTTQLSQRLTNDFGEVKHPQLSPCGRYIAFDANREGSTEAYVLDLNDGLPQKLTHTGAICSVVGWQDNDTILVAGAFEQPFRQGCLYSIQRTGGDLTNIEVGPANAISYGPEKNTMIIQRHGYGYPSWKRYQGGTCAELWLKTDNNNPFQLFCKQNANMIQPLWHNNRIYFISDFQGHGNVYSADLQGQDIRRHTHCEDFYVRSYSIDKDRLVYAQAGQLWQANLDLKADTTPQAVALEIPINSAQSNRIRKFDFSSKTLESLSPNHNGSQLALCHRGRLFIMPSYQGPGILLDNSDHKRYRDCCWIEKTNKVFAICDDGMRDIPVVFDCSGTVALKKAWDKIDLGRVLCMRVSPDGKTVAIANNQHKLSLFDLETGKLREIKHSPYGTIAQFDWSPDSKWLAYRCQNTHETANIMLYSLDNKKEHRVTEGNYHDYAPCFDPDGKYLYFLSHRALNPESDELCFQYNFRKTAKAYVCCLDENAKHPFYHHLNTDESESNDDKTDDEKDNKDTKSKEDDATTKKDKETPETIIHIQNIHSRILPLPVDAGSYTKLLGLSGKVLLITSSWADGNDYTVTTKDMAGSVGIYDFKEQKYEHLFDGISSAELTYDRSQIVYSTPSKQIRIITAGGKPEDKDESYRKGGIIDISRARAPINPQTEWQFMLQEAWRLQKDFFWDQDMSNVPWNDILNRYQRVAERISTRAELNDLIAELHGELGSSHAYVMGGDLNRKRHYSQGQLGVSTVYDIKEKAYKIIDIIDAQDFSDEDLLSPLKAPGVNLSVGDYIYAVNGQTLSATLSLQQALEQQANQYVQLLVKCTKDQSKEKKCVIVKTDSNNHDRIYRAWVEKNRRYVSEKSDGKLGYIHIPDMSKDGYAEFLRSFLQCFDSQGLVVDVRFNGGGHVSSLILQKLALKRIGLDATRWHDANFCYPANAPKGCMVAICNEYAGSDGDMFSHAFKQMKLGKLIGKRTWGGVIGINVRHDLIDGGVTTQPEYAIWLDGVGYGVENHGVDPDEVIEITPEQAAACEDPQLDRAIAIGLEEIKNQKHPDLDLALENTVKPNKQAPKLPKEALVEA
tara:strand:+ start:492 stop:3806 length:3315 start_codon:yes stop_codon:yes gene_type:complete